MACDKTLPTAGVAFGIPMEEMGLKTQSVSLKLRVDTKELKNNCGEVSFVQMYNRGNEVSIVGYGTPSGAPFGTGVDVGLFYVLANAASFVSKLVVGKLIVTEIDVEMSNEDFIKTTVTLKSWTNITG